MIALSDSMQSGPYTVYWGYALRPPEAEDEDRTARADTTVRFLANRGCFKPKENIL
jgi:hypothetical protein